MSINNSLRISFLVSYPLFSDCIPILLLVELRALLLSQGSSPVGGSSRIPDPTVETCFPAQQSSLSELMPTALLEENQGLCLSYNLELEVKGGGSEGQAKTRHKCPSPSPLLYLYSCQHACCGNAKI